MRNSSNEFNIYANMENTKYNTRTSIPLNYLLRNTINYMNSKEKKKMKKLLLLMSYSEEIVYLKL